MKFLNWMPSPSNFNDQLKRASSDFGVVRALAGTNLDFLQTQQLANRINKFSFDDAAGLHRVKLALLTSSTFDHILPSLRVAGIRHGLWIDIYTAPFNQYSQEALEPSAALKQFAPDFVFFAMDAGDQPLEFASTAAQGETLFRERADHFQALIASVKQKLGSSVLFQTLVVPPFPLFGNADRSIKGTVAWFFSRINEWVADQARENQIHMVDVDALAAQFGKREWCHQRLWFHAKQAISPLHAPVYAEQVARVLAAAVGRSKKVLVLDLDNTIWGGVIGDDGVEGLELGQGTGAGEAFVAFQRYVKDLKSRGVILAACSKNDDANAWAPFQKHPEMVLTAEDFSVFVANWNDKASNIDAIAKKLNLGLDAFVFFDDNPMERDLVRQLLPMVSVPEVPEDPSDFIDCLSGSGLFESFVLTEEDRHRTCQYRADSQRGELRSSSHNVEDYLKGLDMTLAVAPFDDIGASRIHQLINKSNQFNLTTRRYSLEQVHQMRNDEHILTYQFHLKDRFGDNGMISVVIARPADGGDLIIDTWLMSCRVLGRHVEQEVLNCIVEGARTRGFKRVVGEFLPTAKNQMVKDHYEKLGFKPTRAADRDLWNLSVDAYRAYETPIRVVRRVN